MKKTYEFPDNTKHIHFVGIGGSGMSPLAEILKGDGYDITGSDNSESDNLDRMRNIGIPVSLGHSADNINGADIVVYTAAVNQDNPELVAAKEQNIPLLERAKLLGIITRAYKNTIAISGTHGKTSTTSMLSQVMMEANYDPSLFIGGRLPLINANGRFGESETMICEACEFMDHYHEMTPYISIILNVDADHLDYFGTLENVINSFHKFATLTKQYIIYNGDDENSVKAVNDIENDKLISFGTSESCTWYAKNIHIYEKACFAYDLYKNGTFIHEVKLGVPGKHHVFNSMAVIIAATLSGVELEQILTSIKHFHGAGRRFEHICEKNGITIIDDFAHHPTEIRATLSTATQMNYSHVWAIFQPYTYSRTAMHLQAFADALSLADTAIVSEIMGSREVNNWNVKATQITDLMANGIYIPTFEEICDYILTNAKPGDLIITMGGGNVYRCARMIAEKL